MKPLARLLALLCALTLMAGCGDTAASPKEEQAPSPELPASADIKIMSWNILNPPWGGTPADMRIDGVVDTLTAEMPDVIGFQEVGPKWHDEWHKLPGNYAAVNEKTVDGLDYMTLLMYNTDTMTLVAHGVEDLDPRSDIRVVVWAVFDVIGTDVSVLVTNTHPHSKEMECLLHNAAYIDIVNGLRKEYPLPTLCVGDFNATETSKAYRLHTKDGFTDAKYADGVDLLADKDSYLKGDFGGEVTEGLGSRDHVFFKGNVTPLTFTTLFENGVDLLSDHLPVVATVTVGK